MASSASSIPRLCVADTICQVWCPAPGSCSCGGGRVRGGGRRQDRNMEWTESVPLHHQEGGRERSNCYSPLGAGWLAVQSPCCSRQNRQLPPWLMSGRWLLLYCTLVLQYIYTTVHLYYCAYTLLYTCITVDLYYYTPVLLHCMIVHLFYCTAEGTTGHWCHPNR